MSVKTIFISLSAILSIALWTANAVADELKEGAAMALKPFDLRDVRLLDGPCKTAQETNRRYLHDLDADRLLYTFRKNAGLPAPGDPLGGWEAPACEVRGHFVGHYLTACALMYASTGDEDLKRKAAGLVAELAKCQAALGGGYLSAFPESFWDRLESKTSLPWAPYYTMHKIMAGLLAQYQMCGNDQALDVLKGMAAYFKKRTDKFTPEELGKILDVTEEGGTCDALWGLYAVTRDPDHRALAEKYAKHSFLDPLARGDDNLTRRHGNTHIPLAIGAMRRFELTGDKRYAHLSAFFWDRVVTARTFATGGTTNAEVWGEPFKLAGTLSNNNHETCKTYNMLKLTRELFCWSGDVRYADFYERAFFNGILGTQEPASGMLEYYVPQAPGYKRVFGTPFDTFWCCYGTGIESFSKLGDSIYFHDADHLVVNLFIASEVRWNDKGVALTQTTRFPEDPKTKLVVHTKQPVGFGLRIHVPEWVAQSPRAHLNDQPIEIDAVPGSFWTLDREWRDGDTVEIALPMNLHVRPMPDDPDLVAIQYGPVVLAGILDDSDPAPILSPDATFPQPQVATMDKVCFLANSPRDLAWLQPVADKPLQFHAVNQPFPITFKPFNQVVGERYGLYWPIIPPGSARHALLEKENKALAFLRKANALATSEPSDSLQKEYPNLSDDPDLHDYRERMVFAMAKLLHRQGKQDEAQNLVREFAEPFIARDREQEVRAILGPAPPNDVQPVIVVNDQWDGSHRKVERDGRTCIITDLAAHKPHVYFCLPAGSPLRGADQTIRMTINHFSEGLPGAKFIVEYDAANPDGAGAGAYTAAAPIEVPAQPGWHQTTIECPHALLNGRQNASSDFRINALGADLAIADVRVSLAPEALARIFAGFDDGGRAVIDRVLPGDGDSEKAHNLKAENSQTGDFMGRKWRHAPSGGWWSWSLKTSSSPSVIVRCTYWGSDVGPRTFDVLVNERVVATTSLDRNAPGRFLAIDYPVPAEILAGQDRLTLTFRPHPGNIAGGVFECRVLKPE